MIDDLLFLVVTMFVLLVASFERPTSMHAPRGWYFDGIRPNGETTLRPVPPPHCGEPIPPDNGPCPDDTRAIGARLYCTNGTQPILVDGIAVGCQRRNP